MTCSRSSLAMQEGEPGSTPTVAPAARYQANDGRFRSVSSTHSSCLPRLLLPGRRRSCFRSGASPPPSPLPSLLSPRAGVRRRARVWHAGSLRGWEPPSQSLPGAGLGAALPRAGPCSACCGRRAPGCRLQGRAPALVADVALGKQLVAKSSPAPWARFRTRDLIITLEAAADPIYWKSEIWGCGASAHRRFLPAFSTANRVFTLARRHFPPQGAFPA